MHLLTRGLLVASLSLAPVASFAADSSISSVSVENTDTTLNGTNTMTVTFTTSAELPETASVIVGIFNEVGEEDISLDFSGVTSDVVIFDSLSSYGHFDMAISDTAPYPGADPVDAVSIALDTTLPAGTYSVVVSNIGNTSSTDQFAVGVSSSGFAFTLSDVFTIADPVFDTTAPVELKVKDITKTSAKLKWGAVTQDGFDVIYTVVLYKKNGDKVKSFKDLTSLTKEIAKNSGLLKAGKTYKFKVKACDAADAETCTSWSAYKSLTMKE